MLQEPRLFALLTELQLEGHLLDSLGPFQGTPGSGSLPSTSGSEGCLFVLSSHSVATVPQITGNTILGNHQP